MKLDELKAELEEIKNVAKEREKLAIIAYCKANNPYKVGGIFEDHIGRIIIEKIGYSAGLIDLDPCCEYYGVELNKDGTPNKKGTTRWASQSNDIKLKTQ